MITIKRFALTLLLTTASLLASSFADEQPATTPNDASVQPQATAPAEVATPPLQQTSQPVQQAPAEQETTQTSWQSACSGWVAAALLLVIVVFMVRNGWEAKKSLGPAGEEPEDDVPDIKDKKMPFIGNPELILNNERFAPGSELFTEAQKMASRRANLFIDALDKKLGSTAKSEDPIDRNTLQSVANALQPEFVDDLCKPGTFWMQTVFGTNPTPEYLQYLPLYIRSIFKPIQVPEGAKLKLEVPALAVGILAALGAIIGAWIVGFFAWTGGMKQPGDMTVLLGATVGAGLFSWLIFWATANETVRKTLEIAVGAVAVGDAVATVASYFINFGSFFGAKKTIQGGFLKRLFLYAACWFVLHLMKRPVVFDRQDYKNKLEALYFERIQAIVLFLSSNKCISDADQKILNDERQHLQEKIAELETRLKAYSQFNYYIGVMYPRVRSVWGLDIRNLERQLRSLAQDFISLGFELPKSERMLFAEQLEKIPKQELEKYIGPDPGYTPSVRRQFTWSEEFKEQFNRIGLVDPGDEVVVLDEPLIQDGNVIKKGNVQCLEDFTELQQ